MGDGVGASGLTRGVLDLLTPTARTALIGDVARLLAVRLRHVAIAAVYLWCCWNNNRISADQGGGEGYPEDRFGGSEQ